MDSGADLGDIFKVDSLNSEHVLFFFLLAESNALGTIDTLVHLETEEVLDLDGLNSKGITVPLSMTLTTIGKWE